ncbi:unnamed protein product [Rhizophagus irregularis]|nr:unnamed protein product [Rhizophagus irregularis]
MSFEFYPGLSQNFSQLLEDTDEHNVIIKVGEGSNTKEFRAHSIILKARSIYFKKALSQDWVTKENNMINFTKQNISPIVFEMIIRYIYTGTLDLKDKDVSDILDLLVASDELFIEELVTFIQKYLIESQTEWIRQNSFKIFRKVIKLESCKQLQEGCYETIYECPEPFLNSPEFPRLEKNILLNLVKQDNLIIEEIELWNYLIKWGIAQTYELGDKNINDLNKWNKEDFLALKKTLEPFISYVRFFDISSKDFHNIVFPFKKVLPETLRKELLSFHMTETLPENVLPPRNGIITVDSVIIRPKHAAILANWTQRNEATARIPKNKFNFNLIYRGSRDGFDKNIMRSKCNGQGATILVIKIKENGIIIGGYNPLSWNYVVNVWAAKNYWKNTTESFIFSLGNKKDFKKVKISRVTDKNYAIYESNSTNIALNFGNSDLVINGTNGTCNKKYYESNILDTNNFSIEEMEIFKFYQSE